MPLVVCRRSESREITGSVPVLTIDRKYQLASESNNIDLPSPSFTLDPYIPLSFKPCLLQAFLGKILELLPGENPSRISQPSSTSDFQGKLDTKPWTQRNIGITNLANNRRQDASGKDSEAFALDAIFSSWTRSAILLSIRASTRTLTVPSLASCRIANLLEWREREG